MRTLFLSSAALIAVMASAEHVSLVDPSTGKKIKASIAVKGDGMGKIKADDKVLDSLRDALIDGPASDHDTDEVREAAMELIEAIEGND